MRTSGVSGVPKFRLLFFWDTLVCKTPLVGHSSFPPWFRKVKEIWSMSSKYTLKTQCAWRKKCQLHLLMVLLGLCSDDVQVSAVHPYNQIQNELSGLSQADLVTIFHIHLLSYTVLSLRLRTSRSLGRSLKIWDPTWFLCMHSKMVSALALNLQL